MADHAVIGSAARGWIGGLCLSVSPSLAAVGASYASLRGCLQAYWKLRAYAINERQDAQFKGCCLFFAMLGASVITGIIFALFIKLTDPSVYVASPSGFLHPNNFLLPCTLTVLWVQKSFDSTLGFPGEGPPLDHRSAPRRQICMLLIGRRDPRRDAHGEEDTARQRC